MAQPEYIDFFISRRGASHAVAQDIADVLKSAGYTVFVQDYDIPHGSNFVAEMHDALKRCQHFIAVISKDYDNSPFTNAEWTNFYAAAAQSDGKRRFVALRVDDCVPDGLFSAVVFADLAGIEDRNERRARILSAAEGRATGAPRRPKIFENLPPRNLNFVGRDDVLVELHGHLMGAERATSCAVIQGIGGMGKTSTAAEYAHHYADAYSGIWWIEAQNRALLIASLASLGTRLDQKIASRSDLEATAKATLEYLAGNKMRLLLIYDNVESPEMISGLIPSNGAQLLITSRWAEWGGWAKVIKLDVLTHDAAERLLQIRSGRSDPAGARILCDTLGELPLALDHAGAYCRLTGTTFADYRKKLDARIGRTPKGASYPVSIATTFVLAIEQVSRESPGIELLMGMCSFLAPTGIPVSLMDETIISEDDRAEALMALAAVSLVEPDVLEDGTPAVRIHRLVQAAMRTRLAEQGSTAGVIETVTRRLTEAFPRVAHTDPKSWPTCAILLPHVLRLSEHAKQIWRSAEIGGNLLAATARYLHGRGLYAEAEPLKRGAIEIAKSALGPEHPEVAHHLGMLGNLLRDAGKYPEAEQHYREAIAIGERGLGRHHQEVLVIQNNLAVLLWNSGRYIEAEQLSRETIEMARDVLGDDHEAVAISLTNLANLLKNTGRAAEAEPLFRQAIEIEQLLGRDNPHVIETQNNLVSLLRDAGRYEESEALYRETLEASKTTFGIDHPRVATSLNSLARLLNCRGQHDEARRFAHDAIAIFDKTVGSKHPLMGRARENLARILADLHLINEAYDQAKEALAIHEKVLRPENIWRRASAQTCADILDRIGRSDDASTLRARYSSILDQPRL